MKHIISFTVLSLAIGLAGTSTTLAMSKKHAHGAAASATTASDSHSAPQGDRNAGSKAYAQGTTRASGDPVTDPRKRNGAGNHQAWCTLDSSCNGWKEWLDDVHSGKLKDLGYGVTE